MIWLWIFGGLLVLLAAVYLVGPIAEWLSDDDPAPPSTAFPDSSPEIPADAPPVPGEATHKLYSSDDTAALYPPAPARKKP